MTSFVKRTLVAALSFGSIAVGLAVPASPASASPAAVAIVAIPATSCPTPSACPYSYIRHSKKTGLDHFVPNKLKAGVTVGTCTTTNYSLAVFNLTKTSEQLTLGGSSFGSPIAPKFGVVICAPSAGIGRFGVASNPKAHLVVTVS